MMLQPKRSREWIYEWLIKWLEPLPEYDRIIFQINKTEYDFCLHFQIAFTVYGIYKDCSTNEMIWFSFENDYFSDESFLKAPRFPNYKIMMDYIIEEFYKKWNTDTIDANE